MSHFHFPLFSSFALMLVMFLLPRLCCQPTPVTEVYAEASRAGSSPPCADGAVAPQPDPAHALVTLCAVCDSESLCSACWGTSSSQVMCWLLHRQHHGSGCDGGLCRICHLPAGSTRCSPRERPEQPGKDRTLP